MHVWLYTNEFGFLFCYFLNQDNLSLLYFFSDIFLICCSFFFRYGFRFYVFFVNCQRPGLSVQSCSTWCLVFVVCFFCVLSAIRTFVFAFVFCGGCFYEAFVCGRPAASEAGGKMHQRVLADAATLTRTRDVRCAGECAAFAPTSGPHSFLCSCCPPFLPRPTGRG